MHALSEEATLAGHRLRVAEIFYSLQGEGVRAGAPSLFVRLSGCSAKHACYASGVRCDTDFEGGEDLTLEEIHARLLGLSAACKWIIFTGGEPLDQLTPDIVRFFKRWGFSVALETSGVRPIGAEWDAVFDWLVIGPKVAEHVLAKQVAVRVNELRYVRAVGQALPQPALLVDNYCISPHSDGNKLNPDNLSYCLDMCQREPRWRLSLQMHKLWAVR